MMDRMMGPVAGGSSYGDPWPVVLSLIAVGALTAVYLSLRTNLSHAEPPQRASPRIVETSKEAGDSQDEETGPGPSALELLPEDERRVIEPVIGSPGLTQIEVADRSDFSKSKVSKALKELEGRGLVYREPQGRTYRVYPGELSRQLIEG